MRSYTQNSLFPYISISFSTNDIEELIAMICE